MPSGDRQLVRLSVAVVAIALGIAFWPVATGRMFVYFDLGSGFLPLRIFLADSLEAGSSALWMPHMFSGFYVHGEGQIGLAHPVRWILYRFLPLTGAFNAECLVVFPAAAAGMALFCRRLRLPSGAAALGGIVFGLSGYLMLRLCHLNTVLVLAHLGWVLFALDGVLRGEPGRRRDFSWCGVALLTGSQLLVGYPGAVYFCGLLEGLFILHTAAQRREWRPVASVGAALCVGVLLGAIQWLPTLVYLGESVRASTSLEFRAEQSLHPWNLLQPLAPWLFRDRVYQVGTFNPIEQAFYLGALAPVALVWIVARWRSLGEHRALVAGLVVASLIALAAALGSHGPLYSALAQLPLIGALRVPARYTFVVSVAGAILTAIAFADVRRCSLEPDDGAGIRHAVRWLVVVPVGAWAIALTALWLRSGPGEPAALLGSPTALIAGAALSTLAAAGFAAAARGLRGAAAALVVLAAFDLTAYAATLWWRTPPQTLEQYLAGIERVPVEPPERLLTDSAIRVVKSREGQLRYQSVSPLTAHGTRLVAGYVGLMPARQLDYTRPNSLRVAGVSMALLEGRRYSVPGALPRARLLSHAVTNTDPATAIESIDVTRTALVAESIELEPGPPGTAEIAEDRPGRIRLRTRASTRQLAVLSESFHVGWRLRVDGRPARVLRVYGDFMGAVVEPGEHELAFAFAPADFALGARLSAMGALLVATAPIVAAWWRGRRGAGG